MRKKMQLAVTGAVMLAVAGLFAGCRREAASAAASTPAAQDEGAQPCDSTKSGSPSELCGKSTDPARWWNAAQITASDQGEAWHTQPTFFPPDVAYTRFPLPAGN